MRGRLRTRCGVIANLAALVLAAAACVSCARQTADASKKTSPVTQIKFARSGGFAGAATNVAGSVQFDAHHAYVDAEGFRYRRELAPEELKQLRAAADPGFFAAAKAGLQPGSVRDGYQYEVTVITEDGASHPLTLGEGDAERLKHSAPGAARLGSWVEKETATIWQNRANSPK